MKSITHDTVHKWMKRLGYHYDDHKTCYYNDGHKREDVVKDRDKRFLNSYFKAEIRAHRWVQIDNKTAEELKKSNVDFLIDCCYIYDGQMNGLAVSMREYHVDTHKCLVPYIKQENVEMGGNLSVRIGLDERPSIMLGQDESTFHQFVFSKKNWKGSTGKSILLPKSRGESVMISGICG